MKKHYKEIMNQIDTFIFDVDGVLTNGYVHVFANGELGRQMNIKDGYSLKAAINAGYRICIISGGTNEGVRNRLKGLGIEDIYLGVHDKTEKFNELVDMYQLSTNNIFYMGDDIPDYEVMQKVGLASCPKDAVPEIQSICQYISQKKGGEGCVRDVIEQVLKVQGKWHQQFDAKFD
ncbi:MAG: HAD hydrolase family protein [Flavobacteriaceae bacterium]|nr:HAD hydrolase family protein [Flavobacteriaceae bacterium]